MTLDEKVLAARSRWAALQQTAAEAREFLGRLDRWPADSVLPRDEAARLALSILGRAMVDADRLQAALLWLEPDPPAPGGFVYGPPANPRPPDRA